MVANLVFSSGNHNQRTSNAIRAQKAKLRIFACNSDAVESPVEKVNNCTVQLHFIHFIFHCTNGHMRNEAPKTQGAVNVLKKNVPDIFIEIPK